MQQPQLVLKVNRSNQIFTISRERSDKMFAGPKIARHLLLEEFGAYCCNMSIWIGMLKTGADLYGDYPKKSDYDQIFIIFTAS